MLGETQENLVPFFASQILILLPESTQVSPLFSSFLAEMVFIEVLAKVLEI